MGNVDYSATIKITFDRPIIVNPEVITGATYVKVRPNPYISNNIIKSGESSQQPAVNAFDGSTSTYWLCNDSGYPPGWIGRNFGEPVTVSRMKVYSGSSWRPNAYKIQASSNGSTWVDIATGNFTNSEGWKTVDFNATSYQYWRLYMSSSYDSYLRIQELEWYNLSNTYNVFGWDVYANEYDYLPGGATSVKHYTVKKVTWADEGYSIILWLDLKNRMWYPIGDVTVDFHGSLVGLGNVPVYAFIETFTPTNISPIFNIGNVEHLEVTNCTLTTTLTTVEYSSYQQGEEHLEITDVTLTPVWMDINGNPV